MVPVAERVVLQQFARAPEPGRVKTRMLSQLSATEACAPPGGNHGDALGNGQLNDGLHLLGAPRQYYDTG